MLIETQQKKIITMESKRRTAFTKKVVAQGLHDLLTEKFIINGKVHVVGHDTGGMPTLPVPRSYCELYLR